MTLNRHNIVLFILSTSCSFVICHFKCLSSLKQDGFLLAVTSIYHELEKLVEQVIPTYF